MILTGEYPTWTCEWFDSYLGVCGHPESRLMACRERICPLVKENK